jgi:hypothetical protein
MRDTGEVVSASSVEFSVMLAVFISSTFNPASTQSLHQHWQCAQHPATPHLASCTLAASNHDGR